MCHINLHIALANNDARDLILFLQRLYFGNFLASDFDINVEHVF